MITSLENKRVKDWCRLHLKKYRKGEYLIYEPEIIEAARKSGHLKTLIYCGKEPFSFEDSVEVSREVLDKINEGREGDYAAVADFIEEVRDPQRRVLILDHLQDPLNIGRIMETAVLFGFDSLLLSEGCADIYNERCLEESKGSLYMLKIYHGDLLEEIPRLQEEGFKVYATGLRGETKELYDAEKSDKVAVILGNEGSGVREEVMDISDEIIKIDMDNIDSLNVAMAAAICAHYFKLL